MIVGLGIDIVEVARLARPRSAGMGTTSSTGSSRTREQTACDARGDRILALAARFAAKEACLKALGTGWAEGLGFRDVEVVREGNQPPRLVLHGEAARRAEALGVVRSHVSLTHQPGTGGRRRDPGELGRRGDGVLQLDQALLAHFLQRAQNIDLAQRRDLDDRLDVPCAVDPAEEEELGR